MTIEIAKIKPEHDVAVAEVVRLVLTEYGANKPGFAWDDPQLDHLSKTYADENSQYLVVIQDGVVMGGGGIGPLEGGDSHVCELQKMYFLPQIRGTGFGTALLGTLLGFAREQGYRHCYLETLLSMSAANGLYNKTGFKVLDKPMGNTGHGSCDTWYLLVL
ncbi:MAG: GNAT family N-acetyltransferase [Algicola sp.]|nr:GNAT family N-acetyltransferase [Algicola sp.]